MTIKEFNPKSDLLKKYIRSFYFMKSDTNKKTEFIYYPHFIETINIFSNSTVKISNDSFMVEKDQTNNSIILSATKTKFRTAVVNDEYDIIGIQFLPLAIHNFFNVNTFSIIETGIFQINSDELTDLILIEDVINKLNALELFFENLFSNKPLEKLDLAVKLIHNSKGNIRMNELESQVNLNRRTILRQFKKYLNCSFEDYKNTVRFRLAIENFSNKNDTSSDLIGDIAYYDQSDFINHFKALSGESPKKLLNHITNNPESIKYFWKMKQI